jgi:mercuric ion transport protein
MPVMVSEAAGVTAHAHRGVATLGTLASIGALISAAACCILPLALAAIGVGSAGLSSVVPFHWPLTIAALVAVAAGWFFYFRGRQACVGEATCTIAAPAKSTLILLCVTTLFVTISACWAFIEAPLMRALGGA